MDHSTEQSFFASSVPLSDRPVSLDVETERVAPDFESREARREYFVRVVAGIIGALSVVSVFALTRPAAAPPEPQPMTAIAAPPAPVPSQPLGKEAPSQVGDAQVPAIVTSVARRVRHAPASARVVESPSARQSSASMRTPSPSAPKPNLSPSTARFPD